MLGLSFLLLTVVFRSVVLSATAVVLNLLSVGAAYGLLVLVFQRGVGAELLGFQQVERVEAWVPVFLFSVLFALSMDYHVFLISRIRERFAQTGDTNQAVVHGIAATGRIITGAALIIVVVFAGFAAGQLVMFQEMGFGVGVALLVDATLIRMVVVPAVMVLFGHWNWYLPSWLEWLPELHVEGEPDPRPHARVDPDTPRAGGYPLAARSDPRPPSREADPHESLHSTASAPPAHLVALDLGRPRLPPRRTRRGRGGRTRRLRGRRPGRGAVDGLVLGLGQALAAAGGSTRGAGGPRPRSGWGSGSRWAPGPSATAPRWLTSR